MLDYPVTYENSTTFSNYRGSTSHIDFPVEKRHLFRAVDQSTSSIPLTKFEHVPNRYEIVRTDSNTHLGTVGNAYTISPWKPNVDIIKEAMEESARNGDINLTDADIDFAVYEGGRKMKMTVDLPHHKIEPVVGDIVKCQLRGLDSYDGTWSRSLQYLPLRLACLNGMVLPAYQLRYKIKHTKQISNNEQIERMIPVICQSVSRFHGEEGKLKPWATTYVNREDALEMLKKTICKYTDSSNGDDRVSERTMDILKDKVYYYYRSLGDYTVWCIYNAVTDWATHVSPENTTGRPHNVILKRQNQVETMLNSDAWNKLLNDSGVSS